MHYPVWFHKMRFRWFLVRVRAWIDDHEPVFCSSCGRIVFKMSTHWETSLTGYVLKLCPQCHEQWFGCERE
jgi:hypothetical protein